MSLRTRFIAVALAAFMIFLTDVISLKLYLYWTFGWFDSLMHVLGGMTAGYGFLLGIALFKRNSLLGRQQVDIDSNNDRTSSVTPAKMQVLDIYNPKWWHSVIGAIIVGSAWEVVEYALHISHLGSGFVSDTLSDFSFDIIGGIISYFLWIS